MKERSIIFSASMVHALLQGRKTQTRRIIKQQAFIPSSEYEKSAGRRAADTSAVTPAMIPCPYGMRGDRLWVKEAWSVAAQYDSLRPAALSSLGAQIFYKADAGQAGKLRSPLFMPRWASRITLEICNTRVERLQDITESDVIAEGCSLDVTITSEADERKRQQLAVAVYCDLWEKIHGEGSWKRNPWVWVLEFAVIK